MDKINGLLLKVMSKDKVRALNRNWSKIKIGTGILAVVVFGGLCKLNYEIDLAEINKVNSDIQQEYNSMEEGKLSQTDYIEKVMEIIDRHRSANYSNDLPFAYKEEKKLDETYEHLKDSKEYVK